MNEISACPTNGVVGKPVKLSTVKNLLDFDSLARIKPDEQFFFCSDDACQTVYYSSHQTYDTSNLRIRVYQKDSAPEVPVCYCFGWTREKLELQVTSGSVSAPGEIRSHIKANRCACDLRNPQGSCCLGNVESYIRGLKE
jgi:hypothetical protein